MARPVWIAEVRFSHSVRWKLRVKHGLTPDEIREAVCFGGNKFDGRWNDHPHYGRRLVVRAESYDGVAMIVYLKPLNYIDGIWICKTAWRL